jgi:hypothetical protein
MTSILGFVYLIFWVLLWLSPVACGLYGVILLFIRGFGKDTMLACISVGFTALSATGIIALSVSYLHQYGFALFVGLPVYCGVLPVVIYSHRQVRSHWEAIGIACLTLLFVGVAVIVFALDGLICILMAAPLACLLSFAGALIANAIMQSRHKTHNIAPMLLACALLPFMVGFEARCDLPPPTSVVVSSIDIAATPETIWKFIPAIPAIPDAPEPIFRTGLAYPLSSEMQGTGVGSKRLCILSTGPLRETITAWEPGQLLRFDVNSCPPSMHELSIYHDLHTVHLENFMVSEWGQFKLIPLDAGHTRLEGTSQYHNRMWPSQYWLPISDFIVHRIHLRVLNFIKAEAENQG